MRFERGVGLTGGEDPRRRDVPTRAEAHTIDDLDLVRLVVEGREGLAAVEIGERVLDVAERIADPAGVTSGFFSDGGIRALRNVCGNHGRFGEVEFLVPHVSAVVKVEHRQAHVNARGLHVELIMHRRVEAVIGRQAFTVFVADVDEAEAFRQRSEELGSGIDLTEVWELATDEVAIMTLEDLAELYWGTSDDAAQKVAILLHLEKDSLHFVEDTSGYRARSREEVEEILARRQREVAVYGNITDALTVAQGRTASPELRTESQ